MKGLKLAIAAGIATMTLNAFAGIHHVSGPAFHITNPNDMKYRADAYGSTNVKFWTERENHPLANDLVVSMWPPVSFPTNVTSHFENNDNKIAAGTMIDSYYLYFDPRSSENAVARFRFDMPILGLISNERNNAANNHFMLSDYLIDPAVPAGNKSTSHFNARGLEIGSNEYVRWIAANEIEVHLRASSPGDQIRVITQAVPEPASMTALGLGLAALIRRRRKA